PGGVAALTQTIARAQDAQSAKRLVALYGSEATEIVADGANIAAEARHAVRVEGAVALEDYWVRRSARAWFSDRGGADVLEPAARAMAPLLGWDAAEEARQVELCRKRMAVENAVLTAGAIR